MKKTTPQFMASGQRQTRAHLVLFCKDTPFRPQRVQNKNRYVRQDKHTHRLDF